MLMRIVSVERQIFGFKYSTGRTKYNSITISLRLLRLFICFYLRFPHLPFRTQIMKLRTRDSRTAVLLTNLCGHDKFPDKYIQFFCCLPLYRTNKMAPLPGIG